VYRGRTGKHVLVLRFSGFDVVDGAHAVLCYAKQNPEKYPWLTQLLARRPFKVVAVAHANKMARMAWALLAQGGTYRAPELAAAGFLLLGSSTDVTPFAFAR
jgi:hypothetical protein